MRYLTKEWYETMQKTDVHLLLKISAGAERFSEAYFRKLYEQSEAEWLALQKEGSEVDLEDPFSEDAEMILPDVDDAGLEEELRKSWPENPEEAVKRAETARTFDPVAEQELFRKNHQMMVEYLQSILPPEILDGVADIRVLALDRASSEVKKTIRNWCRGNEKAVKAAMAAYEEEYTRMFESHRPGFLERFGFHDCTVASLNWEGKDLIMRVDDPVSSPAGIQIIFNDAEIISRDKPVHGAWWLYEEVFRIKDGYEIHILLENEEPMELVLSVSDVGFR